MFSHRERKKLIVYKYLFGELFAPNSSYSVSFLNPGKIEGRKIKPIYFYVGLKKRSERVLGWKGRTAKEVLCLGVLNISLFLASSVIHESGDIRVAF